MFGVTRWYRFDFDPGPERGAPFDLACEGCRMWVGNEGFVKLVEDEDRGVLIGATAMGPAGGDVLSMPTLAVEAAIPTRDLRRMIYAYPTFHRAVEDALAALAR